MKRIFVLYYGALRAFLGLKRYKILSQYFQNGKFYLIYDSYLQVYVVGSGAATYDDAVKHLLLLFKIP